MELWTNPGTKPGARLFSVLLYFYNPLDGMRGFVWYKVPSKRITSKSFSSAVDLGPSVSITSQEEGNI